MPKQKFHYYTIRNVLTGEPTLVRAKNQAQGARGFFDLRFSMELTSQEDLVKFARAGVVELDLTSGVKSVSAAQRLADRRAVDQRMAVGGAPGGQTTNDTVPECCTTQMPPPPTPLET